MRRIRTDQIREDPSHPSNPWSILERIMPDRYDLIVIGAGPGGYVCAIRAAQLGMKVACIDKRATLGGTCLNIGCIPSKALLDSSEHFAFTRAGLARHGIRVADVQLDLGAMMSRKDKVVKGLTDGVAFLFKKNKITPIHGSARLGQRGQVAVKGAKDEPIVLEAPHIVLATGSEPAALPGLPFDGVHLVSSTEALAFDKVPQHLIVVGGGYIGLELGSVWNRLGSKVTVLEFLPRILPLSDGEIADALHRSLVKQGLTFHLETKVTRAGAQGGEVVVHASSKGKELEFRCDKVLVAVGRRPYVTGLGLKELGVTIDEKTGKVQVDEDFETNVPGIYAI